MNSIRTRTYRDWETFPVDSIPSTLHPYPILYERIEPDQRIIDIGCGEGIVALDLLAKGFGPIVGIDVNEEGIQRANDRLANRPESQQEKCCFQVRDALDTGYPESHFDVGIMQAFMTTLTTPSDRLAVLREAHRIIKPEGGLYLAEYMQTWWHPKYYKRYIQGEHETGKAGSFFARDPESGEILYQAHHYSERELVDLLLEAGFQVSYWSYERFITRTGNTINGAVIWASSTPDLEME